MRKCFATLKLCGKTRKGEEMPARKAAHAQPPATPGFDGRRGEGPAGSQPVRKFGISKLVYEPAA